MARLLMHSPQRRFSSTRSPNGSANGHEPLSLEDQLRLIQRDLPQHVAAIKQIFDYVLQNHPAATATTRFAPDAEAEPRDLTLQRLQQLLTTIRAVNTERRSGPRGRS